MRLLSLEDYAEGLGWCLTLCLFVDPNTEIEIVFEKV